MAELANPQAPAQAPKPSPAPSNRASRRKAHVHHRGPVLLVDPASSGLPKGRPALIASPRPIKRLTAGRTR